MTVLMWGLLPFSFFFFLALPLSGIQCKVSSVGGNEMASTPPRGWNSYDSFAWIVSEEEFLANAEIVSKRLLQHGYEYVVVDYLWYRRLVDGANRDSYGYDVLDSWGRVIPDPQRWPSSNGGKGFQEVAKRVHDMGLKFGIHLMRGISKQAVDANMRILNIGKGGAYEEGGRQWGARDIGMKEMACSWMKHGFMSVNTDLGAGRAFLRSLYTQYAEWGVDFVKLDCIFGDDLDIKEIMTVSELLEELDRPMLLSLSPGTSVNVDIAEHVSNRVNMYRVTGDDWDTWPDVSAHFDISRDVAAAHLIGANGLHGRSWPDLDMLPLGWLTNSYSQTRHGTRIWYFTKTLTVHFLKDGNQGPYRKCNLTLDEQRTQMTLWSMVRSPLIFGGDLRNTDESTFHLITNPTLLEINSFSTNNMEFAYIATIPELQNRNTHVRSARKSLEILNISNNSFMSHTSCKNPSARGWFVQKHDQVSDQICWNYNKESNNDTPLCLYKRNLLHKFDEDICKKHQGKFQLSESDTRNICMDASSKRRVAASEPKSKSFSPCKWEASQMWVLNDDGTLMSNYSGLCAIVGAEKDDNSVGGARAWIATGRKGEVYLAFFNLNSGDTYISASIQDLAKALPAGSVGKGSCMCTETWTGKDFGMLGQTIAMNVPSHGSALFVLHCS